MQAQATSSTNPVITTIGYGNGYDYDTAAVGSPNITKSGWVQGVAYAGRWTSPKALGRPAQLPKLSDLAPPDPTKTPDLCDPGCPSSPAQPLAQRGDPVDVATGNVFEQVLDYTTVGQNPLAFIRYYNSKTTMDTLATTLGVGWRHNYDRYLRIVSSTEVDAERSDGKVVTFNLVSTVWTPNADVDIKLTKSGSTYTLTDHDDTIETCTASGSIATLDSIAKPNG